MDVRKAATPLIILSPNRIQWARWDGGAGASPPGWFLRSAPADPPGRPLFLRGLFFNAMQQWADVELPCVYVVCVIFPSLLAKFCVWLRSAAAQCGDNGVYPWYLFDVPPWRGVPGGARGAASGPCCVCWQAPDILSHAGAPAHGAPRLHYSSLYMHTETLVP